MPKIAFLDSGEGGAGGTVLLAHGAGAAMDTPWMEGVAARLAGHGLRVLRFEFAYMAGRRSGGSKRPPPKVELLCEEYRLAVAEVVARVPGPLFIGGKSMGGRVASMVAQDVYRAGQVAGVVCLGYPFHPPAKPEKTRVVHLQDLTVPTLICQGSRDPFGTREDVVGYGLSPAITLAWLEDGDHDLKPRKRVTGKGLEDHLDTATQTITGWVAGQTGGAG